jgi:hypothetical protein
MRIVFGPTTCAFNGRADDGDSSNGGLGNFQGSAPGGCSDARTSVHTGGPGSGAPNSFELSCRADGWSGSNADHAPKARAYASVTQAFSLVGMTTSLPWLNALLNRFLRRSVTANVAVTAKVELGVGIGDVAVDATIVGGPAGGAAGPPIKLALTRTYHLETNPASAAQIDVSRNGTLMTTISNPGTFTDQFAATAALRAGSYVLDLSLQASDTFDGRADVMGIARTSMLW